MHNGASNGGDRHSPEFRRPCEAKIVGVTPWDKPLDPSTCGGGVTLVVGPAFARACVLGVASRNSGPSSPTTRTQARQIPLHAHIIF